MSRIHVEIDKLALGGLDPAARRAFVISLEKELRSILAEPVARGEWARTHRTPVLRLNRMSMEPGAAGAGKLGRQVARGIGKGLKP
ncbi:MAG: hypothetical protein WBX18_03200 [Terracidiphilus sp.]